MEDLPPPRKNRGITKKTNVKSPEVGGSKEGGIVSRKTEKRNGEFAGRGRRLRANQNREIIRTYLNAVEVLLSISSKISPSSEARFCYATQISLG